MAAHALQDKSGHTPDAGHIAAQHSRHLSRLLGSSYRYYLSASDLRKLPASKRTGTVALADGTFRISAPLGDPAVLGSLMRSDSPELRRAIWDATSRLRSARHIRTAVRRHAQTAKALGHPSNASYQASLSHISKPSSIAGALKAILRRNAGNLAEGARLLDRVASHLGMESRHEADSTYLTHHAEKMAGGWTDERRAFPVAPTVERVLREITAGSDFRVLSFRTLATQPSLLLEAGIRTPMGWNLTLVFGTGLAGANVAYCMETTQPRGTDRRLMIAMNLERPHFTPCTLSTLAHEIGHALHKACDSDGVGVNDAGTGVSELVSSTFEEIAVCPSFLARVADPAYPELRRASYWMDAATARSATRCEYNMTIACAALGDSLISEMTRTPARGNPLDAVMEACTATGVKPEWTRWRKALEDAQPLSDYAGCMHSYSFGQAIAHFLIAEADARAGGNTRNPHRHRFAHALNLCRFGLPTGASTAGADRKWKDFNGVTYRQARRKGAELMAQEWERWLALTHRRLDALHFD